MQNNNTETRAALSVSEFCSWAGISASTFYRELNAGRLKTHKIGRKTVIKTVEANSWLNKLPEAV